MKIWVEMLKASKGLAYSQSGNIFWVSDNTERQVRLVQSWGRERLLGVRNSWGICYPRDGALFSINKAYLSQVCSSTPTPPFPSLCSLIDGQPRAHRDTQRGWPSPCLECVHTHKHSSQKKSAGTCFFPLFSSKVHRRLHPQGGLKVQGLQERRTLKGFQQIVPNTHHKPLLLEGMWGSWAGPSHPSTSAFHNRDSPVKLALVTTCRTVTETLRPSWLSMSTRTYPPQWGQIIPAGAMPFPHNIPLQGQGTRLQGIHAQGHPHLPDIKVNAKGSPKQLSQACFTAAPMCTCCTCYLLCKVKHMYRCPIHNGCISRSNY